MSFQLAWTGRSVKMTGSITFKTKYFKTIHNFKHEIGDMHVIPISLDWKIGKDDWLNNI